MRDPTGRKIGEILPNSPADQAVGCGVILALFWKPLFGIILLIACLWSPFLIFSDLRKAFENVRIANENPKIEAKYIEDILATIEPGIEALNTSLKSKKAEPTLAEYFDSAALDDIQVILLRLKSQNIDFDQTTGVEKIVNTRWLDKRVWDTPDLATVQFACVRLQVQTRRSITVDGKTTEQIPDTNPYLKIGLIHSQNRWRIIEMYDIGFQLSTTRVITSYC